MKLTNLIPIKAGKTLSRLCIIGALSLGSSFVFAQNQQVRLSGSNLTLKAAFKQIEQQTKLFVDYNTQDVNDSRVIKKVPAGNNVKNVLEQLLEGTNCSITFSNGHVIISRKAPVSSETKKVTGVVKDEKGGPIIGANVVEKGTTNGIITDIDGNFELNVASSSVLEISYIGYISQEIKVGNNDQFRIRLVEDTQNLDEVVVVGYGTSRKRDIVSAMANVKGKTFSSASTSNVQDILQGKVAGLDIRTSRFPGDNQSINIRGARSLNAGNSPLVIVDGVPGSLSDLNSYDIESLEVLKDAASSAIYGSMGANGVILVTTKRGRKGVKREVNFNSYVGVNVPHMIKMQSGAQYAQFRRDGYRFAHGWDNSFTDEDVFSTSELDVIKSGDYTDWQDLMYRNGFIQSYHLGISNSGEKTQLYLSFKYDDEQGYYRTHDVKNLNLTLTADHELASFWKIGSSIRLRRNSNSGYKTIGNDILYMTPLAKPYKENGEMDFFPNPINTSGYNPLANYLPGQFIDDTQKNIINLNLTSDIKITNWLSMHTNFGFIYNNYEKGYFYGKDSHNNKGVKNSSGKNYNKYDQYTLNHIISYDKSFGDHHLTADLVGEIQSYRYEESALSGENQPVEYTTYHNLGTNSDNIKISSGYKEWSLASGLVRVRYNYKNKYFLNGAIRADGSSRLAKGKQWAFFPSGGVGWSLKDEDFLSGTEWVSALKARFSYGTVGNTAISPYQTLSSLTQDKYLWGEGDSDKFYVYYPGSIINLDLGWEISRTINAGLDFGFLNNKLNGYIEFYNTKTSDLLMKRAIPTFTGFNEIWQNIGKTQNKGFEFNLNYAPVRTKDLNIDFTFNASRNWEKILELISGEDLPNNKWFIGEPLAVLYNYEKLGVWQYGEEEDAAKYNASVGDLKIKDQDGDGTISAAKDRVILGQERPKWIASLGANIQYKNFDFSFNINSRWGYSFNLAPFNDVVLDGQRWLPAVDYWTPDNPTNNYPKADQSNGWDTYRSANGYQKGDHIKLQDVTVGYSFDKLLSKTFIKKARFYVQLRNVAYLYKATDFGIMPEAPDMNYTIPSSYNFGVNVTF